MRGGGGQHGCRGRRGEKRIRRRRGGGGVIAVLARERGEGRREHEGRLGGVVGRVREGGDAVQAAHHPDGGLREDGQRLGVRGHHVVDLGLGARQPRGPRAGGLGVVLVGHVVGDGDRGAQRL